MLELIRIYKLKRGCALLMGEPGSGMHLVLMLAEHLLN